MAKDKKPMNENFVKYMEEILNNPIYSGLAYTRKKDGTPVWIAPKTTEVGCQRIAWVKTKAQELHINTDTNYYSKVMFEIHPTKQKPCHVCGKIMSLYYIYPSKSFIEKINSTFNTSYTFTDSLYEIVEGLKEYQTSEEDILLFLAKEFKLQNATDLQTTIKNCEKRCRIDGMAKLGPGAMSNFPDRFDGFHSYNRCCREKEDKGRHRDNMNTYNKDRRAYEYWSDGNIKLANSFMHSIYFKGVSADHIGPISLGFKHESFLLKKMTSSDNSAKRDRLFISDVKKLIEIETKNYGYKAISRQSELIWETLKNNYNDNQSTLNDYQNILKKSTSNYLDILWQISQIDNGTDFLLDNIIKPQFEDFKFSYEFDENGYIKNKFNRHITDATKKEWDRLIRIHFESINDYHYKENRNIKFDIGDKASFLLIQLLSEIKEKNINSIITFNKLLLEQQRYLINTIK